MDVRDALELAAHLVVMLLVLVVALAVIRAIAGEPLRLVEIGVAVLIGLVYPRVAGRLGYPPSWGTD